MGAVFVTMAVGNVTNTHGADVGAIDRAAPTRRSGTIGIGRSRD